MSVMRKPARLDYFNFDQSLVIRLATAFGVDESIDFRPILLDGDVCSLIDVRSATSRKMVLRAGKRDLFLKQVPWYCDDPASIRFAQSFQDAARRAGRPVPLVLRTGAGDGFIEIESATFTMTEYVRGSRFAYHVDQVRAAAAELARLHQCPQGTLREPAADAFDDDVDHLELAGKLARERSDEDGAKCLDRLGELVRTTRSEAVAQGWSELPVGRVHGDYSPWNVLFVPDARPAEVAAIVDFDNAHWGPVIRDLGESLVTYCWLRYDGDSTSFSAELPQTPRHWQSDLLSAYSSVRGLTDTDVACLPYAAMAVGIELICLGYIRGDYGADVLSAAPRWLARLRDSVTDELWRRS